MVPRTVAVTPKDCRGVQVCARRKDATISISTMTTAEACQHFARDRRNWVCALNYANGQVAGGGYKNGATAQEEDLCRQFPTLYSTLYNGVRDGLYPFGPCTLGTGTDKGTAKYSDVLYTSGLSLARGSMEEGYPFLGADK